MTWQILTGDCVEQMRTLGDSSIDAVVCDPPYGIGFMGHEWDQPGDHGPVGPGRGEVQGGKKRVSQPNTTVSFGGDPHPAMEAGRYDLSLTANRRYQGWCEAWARECLRVLKPGGHLLASCGSRTYQRMACGIEDAGFEIRDSIMWLYGSGFPKSLDVSKAIDKAAGVEREVLGHREAFGYPDGGTAVESNRSGAGEIGPVPEPGGVPITMPATAEAQQWNGWGTALKPAHEPIVVARKPLATAGVNVLANVENGLRQQGVNGAIRWTKSKPASDAARPGPSANSSSTDPPSTEATSADRVDVSETQNGASGSASDSGPTTLDGGRPTGSTSGTTRGGGEKSSALKSSLPTATSAPAAESASRSSSPSITSTEEEAPTDGRSTARSTSSSSEKDSPTVIESFAGIATGLTGSRAVVLISRLSNGSFAWPDGLPESQPGRSQTVAANVLEHGTGGINIDATRLGTDDQHKAKCESAAGNPSNATGDVYGEYASPRGNSWTPLGRWPANVVLDPEAAAMLDEQTGELHSQDPATRKSGSRATGVTEMGTGRSVEYGDSGGASRFFYCAKTSRAERNAGLNDLPGSIERLTTTPTATIAKGRSGGKQVDDRDYVPAPNANHHPTVKPINLMRWLVRLVTPPGGVVLDPFTGSGSTGCAAVLEGFDFIGCEREPEYVAIAESRIAFWAQHIGREIDDVLGLVAASDKARKLADGVGQIGLELDVA